MGQRATLQNSPRKIDAFDGRASNKRPARQSRMRQLSCTCSTHERGTCTCIRTRQRNEYEDGGVHADAYLECDTIQLVQPAAQTV